MVSFLKGEKGVSFRWLDDLGLPLRVDLAMLSFHLGILPLKCATLESLHRALIDNGNWPNWAMLIHVWAVSDPTDPTRRLMLSSLYLNVVVLGGTLKLPGKGREPDVHDYEEDMWLSDLHEFIEPCLMVDQLEDPLVWRSFNEAWHPRFSKRKFRLDCPLERTRSLRESRLLRDNSFFKFTDTSASLRERIASFDSDIYIPDTEFIDIPSLLDIPEQHTTQISTLTSSKRKSDAAPPTSPRPSKAARLTADADQESDAIQEPEATAERELIRIQCREDAIWVDRQSLISVSSVVEKQLTKFPALASLRFREIYSCDLQMLIEVAEDIDAVEEACKDDSPFTMRSMIGMIMAVEYLGNPNLEERLLAILKPMFTVITMDVLTCQWIFDNAPKDGSKLCDFAGECMHWVAMKNGEKGNAAWHNLCYRIGTALGSLFDRMEALQAEYGEMYGPGEAVEVTKGTGKEVEAGKGEGEGEGSEEKGAKGKGVVKEQREKGKGKMTSGKGEEEAAVNEGKGTGEEEVKGETEKGVEQVIVETEDEEGREKETVEVERVEEKGKEKEKREHPCAGMAWKLGALGLKGEKFE